MEIEKINGSPQIHATSQIQESFGRLKAALAHADIADQLGEVIGTLREVDPWKIAQESFSAVTIGISSSMVSIMQKEFRKVQTEQD